LLVVWWHDTGSIVRYRTEQNRTEILLHLNYYSFSWHCIHIQLFTNIDDLNKKRLIQEFWRGVVTFIDICLCLVHWYFSIRYICIVIGLHMYRTTSIQFSICAFFPPVMYVSNNWSPVQWWYYNES